MRLCFYVLKRYYGAYSDSNGYGRIKGKDSIDHYLKVCLAGGKSPAIYVSTKVGLRSHIPMLDCDNYEDYETCISLCKKWKIPWATVMSSHRHYWVFLDKISTFHKALNLVREFKGADKDYIRSVKQTDRFLVRAFPKGSTMPVFYDMDPSVSKTLRRWIEMFKSWWESNNLLEDIRYQAAEHAMFGKKLEQMVVKRDDE